MASAKFERGVAILQIPESRLQQARSGEWIPFERLIRVSHDDPEYQSHKLMPSFYAQSWLAVHYGMVANAEFRNRMFQYLADLNALMPQDQAARRAFGEDLSVTDRKLREYARAARISPGSVDYGPIPAVEIVQPQPLGDTDAMSLVADLMLDAHQPSARAAPLIQALEHNDTNKARVAIFRARIAQRANDDAGFDAAVAQAEAALASGDWLQRRELGAVLLTGSRIVNPESSRISEAVAADVNRARKLFAEAITLNRDDVESLYGFGAAAVSLDQDLALAEQSLLAAYQRAPSNAEIAAALANLRGRQRDLDGMVPYLEDVARFASDLQVRRWAAETLIKVEKQIEERDGKN
jgi:tetratricopeptide (TPR) repeat protein